MENIMKILYVASEANPYIASGGLGDVIGALPAEITKAESNIKAEVILPFYDTISDFYKSQMQKVTDIAFKLSWRNTGATIYKIENDTTVYFFVENHYYFDRGKLYGELDDAERFAFFSMSVIEFILRSGNVPDIIHANDWQTALTVIYLKTKYKNNKELSDIRTLYTIHNIEYQGQYDMGLLGDIFAIDEKYTSIVEYNGCINLMKGALTVSDCVSTVSPNYAQELQYDFFSFGLSEIIRRINKKFGGVINGIDTSYFSPEADGDIYFPYSKRAYKAGKAKNKKALQEELGLQVNRDVPLLVMITRLTEGKGIDLVLHIIEELLSLNVQMVILGTGEKKYENAFLTIEQKHENFKALIKFDRVLSKKIYAAADMFIMPSKSEPCGLAQMIACSYGTVPIVRAVGGLADSIIPFDKENSNGFRFNNFNAHELLFAIKKALSVYNTDDWQPLVKRAINSDFSWHKSAVKYIEIYNNLLNL